MKRKLASAFLLLLGLTAVHNAAGQVTITLADLNMTSSEVAPDPSAPVTLSTNLTSSAAVASTMNTSSSAVGVDSSSSLLNAASINGTLALLDALKGPRRGRNMNFELPSADVSGIGFWGPKMTPTKERFLAIQSRILNGGSSSGAPGEAPANSFRGDSTRFREPSSGKVPPTSGFVSSPLLSSPSSHSSKYDAVIGVPQGGAPSSSQHHQPTPLLIKTQPPQERFSSVSYAAPDGGVGGMEPSDLIPYYHDRNPKTGYSREPVMYQLVPVPRPTPPPYSFHDAVKDTIFKVKDHVSGTVSKVKHALGFHGFSEKIASPDAILAVAPVAAGLLAGGLAAAYFASKSHKNASLLPPFNIFGKRSVRDVVTEEDLNHIVARLDPVQREYLQKLQFYGPQRWKDVTCAKYIFCDVMSKATPLHVLDMQRKIGIFLSRMDETTARYVEVILKDVMLAIQARDCSRFSCAQPGWGGLPLHRPPLHHAISHHHPHLPLFPGHNFLRQQ